MSRSEYERMPVTEDVWIPSTCFMCYNSCGILAHRVNGVLVKIEGNPEAPNGLGRICAKGNAGIMQLYDPSRVNHPLKRTNPEKGIGVDPKWKRITWEEALDEVTQRLKEAREKDPRSLIILFSVVPLGNLNTLISFAGAFGTTSMWDSGAGNHCGNGEHFLTGLYHSAWWKEPDFTQAKYVMLIGSNLGAAANYGFTTFAQKMAEARERGMKLVVVDPMQTGAARKADEWIPIRPGTDAMFCLAVVNLLLNEMGLYDVDYMKHHTNGPYLIKPDGYYMRDPESGRPLVWDPVDGRAKPYDDPTVKDHALEGRYVVHDVECKPAFQMLKDHVRQYTPEEAERVTTVPASTIRRVAKEFGEAAMIGKTIKVDGRELPLRPASVMYFKGSQAHRHSYLTALSIDMLNEVVGNAEAVGGAIGNSPVCNGHPGTGRPKWGPSVGPDGLMATGPWIPWSIPYPPLEPKKPQSYALRELFPYAISPSGMPFSLLDPKKFGFEFEPQAQIVYGSNGVMTMADPNKVAEAMKRIPFTVSFSLFLDEITEFADIVLPDTCYLERLEIPFDGFINLHAMPGGVGDWYWGVTQPVVEPLFERRNANTIFFELADRLGILGDMYGVINAVYGLEGEYKLDPSKQYSLEEVADRIYRFYFGDEHGLEWFKKNGVMKWPRKPEEIYYKQYMHVRVPVYLEFVPKTKEQMEKLLKKLKITDLDLSDYRPLPDWKPCPSHEEKQADYDLYAIYYRAAQHTFSSTYNNAWLDGISQRDPYTYYITINAHTAAKKGIKDGDWIWVEASEHHGRLKGLAKLSKAIHPEVVGMANCGGHWSKYLPLASQPGKGVCFEWLVPLELTRIDGVSSNQDLCVKVKVYKA